MKKGVFSGYNRNIDPLDDLGLSRCEDDFKVWPRCCVQYAGFSYSIFGCIFHVAYQFCQQSLKLSLRGRLC